MNYLRSWLKLSLCLILPVSYLTGCLYADVQVPRAYRSASPMDVQAKSTDKVVVGKSCNRSVLFLVAWGNAGFAEAIRQALADEPIGSVLYDVHVDTEAQAYLFGLYVKSCTVVTGKVGSL